MVGWIILGVIIGLIVLIMLIPIGADIRYEEGIVRISAKAAGIRLQLIPKPKKKRGEDRPEKQKKQKAPKEEKPKKEETEKKKRRSLPFNTEEILELLKTVLRAFGRFGRKFRVERFVLHWVAAGRDPYLTARIFAVVNAGLSQLAPICTERFHCKDSSVWTDIDFSQEDMFLEFGLTMTIRIGQIIGTGISIAFGALKILLKSKQRNKRERKEDEAALQQWLKEHPDEASALKTEPEQLEENTEKIA